MVPVAAGTEVDRMAALPKTIRAEQREEPSLARSNGTSLQSNAAIDHQNPSPIPVAPEAKTEDVRTVEGLWRVLSTYREDFIANVRQWAKQYLTPFTGLIGIAVPDEPTLVLQERRPVVFSPYLPDSGHAIFIASSLDVARHYVDHLLYSLRSTTPASDLPLQIFAAHPVEKTASLFLRDHLQSIALQPRADWIAWAERIRQRQQPDSWRQLRLLVVDDIAAWYERSRGDAAWQEAITTVLTEGLQQRVLVIATVTYATWKGLPQIWRKAFRVGFYSGATSEEIQALALPPQIRQFSPTEMFIPRRDDKYLRVHSVAPQILEALAQSAATA